MITKRSAYNEADWAKMYPNILRKGAGRGAFSVVCKAMLWERVGIEVFSTEISKRKLLSSKTEPRVVAVKVLLGETKYEINARPYKQ